MTQLFNARAANGAIGHEGKLPWHLPADLKRFKTLTIWLLIDFQSLTSLAAGRSIGQPSWDFATMLNDSKRILLGSASDRLVRSRRLKPPRFLHFHL